MTRIARIASSALVITLVLLATCAGGFAATGKNPGTRAGLRTNPDPSASPGLGTSPDPRTRPGQSTNPDPSPTPMPDPNIPVFPPIPETGDPAPDDSLFQLTPAPQYLGRVGVAQLAGSNSTATALVTDLLLFLDGGALSLTAQAELTGGSGQALDSIEANLRLRARYPISKGHLVWWGLGADLAGRTSHTPELDSYGRAELPVGLIGIMKAFGPQCVLYIFGKAGVAIVDTQTQSLRRQDQYLRPAVGAEGFFQCHSIRIFAEAEHVMALAHLAQAPTQRGSLETAKTWKLLQRLELGVFLKGDWEREQKPTTPEPTGPSARTMRRFTGGLEIRY